MDEKGWGRVQGPMSRPNPISSKTSHLILNPYLIARDQVTSGSLLYRKKLSSMSGLLSHSPCSSHVVSSNWFLNFGLVFETALAAFLSYTPGMSNGLRMYPLA